jgi:hypothetical protein
MGDMKIIVDLPGVHLEVHTQPVRVHTLHSPIVESAQLSPFAVPQFSLTSAVCLYVYTFCRNLGLPAEFSRLVLHLFSDPNSHQLDRSISVSSCPLRSQQPTAVPFSRPNSALCSPHWSSCRSFKSTFNLPVLRMQL